jgi:hypothetical protein
MKSITFRTLATAALAVAIVPFVLAVLLASAAEGSFKRTLKDTPEAIKALFQVIWE